MGQVWMDRFSKYMKYGPPTFLSKNDETWSPPYLLSIWTNCTWDHIAKTPGATAVMTMCYHMLGQATEELFRYVATTSGIPYHKHCRSWIFQRRAGGWFHKSWSTCDVDGGWVDWILIAIYHLVYSLYGTPSITSWFSGKRFVWLWFRGAEAATKLPIHNPLHKQGEWWNHIFLPIFIISIGSFC